MATPGEDKSRQPAIPRPAKGTSDLPVSGPVPVANGRRMPVSIGDVVNGKYIVESLLGEGGVGVVVAARNIELDEPVALKFLRPEILGKAEIVARFMREAKAACSIKSEYVANVYDVGTMPDGAPFLVMEHLEGKDLGSVIEERGQLGYREATEYIMQTCEALAVAHAKGVIHRDIKPENLFLTSRAGMNVIKVLDFGISKAALTGSIFGSALPQVHTVNLMGTPLYMAPEQIRSADGADMRSDIWALGMVLYEILTGRLPLAAPTLTELCAAILEAPLVPITEYRTDLPAGYADVLARCIERDPSKRFQNVAEMSVAFMPFAPKRARICAERAAQALREAGLVEESSVRFLSTVPPPNPSGASITQPSGLPIDAATGSYPSFTAAGVSVSKSPSSGSLPVIPPMPGLPEGMSASPSPSTPATLPTTPPPPTAASRAKLFFAFATVAVLAAGVAAGFTHLGAASQPKAPAAAATTAAGAGSGAAAPWVAVPPSDQPSKVGAAADPTPPATGAAPQAAPGKKGAAAFAWPAPKGGPATKAGAAPSAAPLAPSAPAAPATPAVTTKKSSEDPDLGY